MIPASMPVQKVNSTTTDTLGKHSSADHATPVCVTLTFFCTGTEFVITLLRLSFVCFSFSVWVFRFQVMTLNEKELHEPNLLGPCAIFLSLHGIFPLNLYS